MQAPLILHRSVQALRAPVSYRAGRQMVTAWTRPAEIASTAHCGGLPLSWGTMSLEAWIR